MKKTFALLMALLLVVSVSAFSPPSPFPVVVAVEMGGAKVVGQVVVVEIVDSETGNVYDRNSFVTDGEGRTLFDLGDFRGCSTYVQDGACYAFASRTYAGDNLRFSTVYNGLRYEVVKGVEDLRLEVGVDVKTKWVKLFDVSAPVQVVEKEVVKEVVVEVVVEKPVEVIVERIVCEDGTVVGNVDECPIDWSANEKLIMGLVGLVVVGLGALYLYDKKKYKWAKGMSGILESKLKQAGKLKKEGKIDAAKKALETARKTATTLLDKYVKKDDKKN